MENSYLQLASCNEYIKYRKYFVICNVYAELLVLSSKKLKCILTQRNDL